MKISIPIPSHAQLHGGGFEAGILHPVLGLDHLLAMVAVGIIATRLGGKYVYLVPLAFVSVMFVGALFGFNHISFVYDEIGIAFSVIVLGLMIAFNQSLPIILVMISVSIFAFFHGHAHGVELPRVSLKEMYALGFIIATTGLHVTGIILTLVITKIPYANKIFALIGGLMVIYGTYLIIGYG